MGKNTDDPEDRRIRESVRVRPGDGLWERAKKRLSKRALLPLVSAGLVGALSLWIAGVFGDLGSRTVDAIVGQESRTATKPPDLAVQRLPSGALSQQVVPGYGVMVPRALADIPRPPTRGNDVAPVVDDRFREWMDAVGGVHAYNTVVEFATTYSGDDPVLITGIRAVVVKRRPAMQGTHVLPAGGDSTNVRVMLFDLDSPSARLVAQENPLSGKRWRFPLTVSRGSDEFFLILGRTEDHDVTWYLEVDYVLKGEARTARVDDGGTPFRTSATSRASETAYFPADTDPWPLTEPSFGAE